MTREWQVLTGFYLEHVSNWCSVQGRPKKLTQVNLADPPSSQFLHIWKFSLTTTPNRRIVIVNKGSGKANPHGLLGGSKMTKSNFTRKQSLSIAINALNYLNMEAISIGGLTGDDYTEVADVLAHMLEQIAKPRAKAVSKARLMNENLAAEIAKILPAEGLTSKQIVELGNPAIISTQKASAVMRVAEELGLARKVKDGKKISYVPAETEDAEDE